MARSGVYSTQFFLGNVTAGFTTVYTVPAGNVAVLRDISGNPSGSGDQSLAVVVSGIVVLDLVADPGTAGAAGSIHAEVRIVMPAGQELQLGSTDGCGVVLSGYLLTP